MWGRLNVELPPKVVQILFPSFLEVNVHEEISFKADPDGPGSVVPVTSDLLLREPEIIPRSYHLATFCVTILFTLKARKAPHRRTWAVPSAEPRPI